MPVPDEQKLYEDFGHCEFCDKCYEDSKFVRVLFCNDKEGAERKYRIFEMCKNCRSSWKRRTSICFSLMPTQLFLNTVIVKSECIAQRFFA